MTHTHDQEIGHAPIAAAADEAVYIIRRRAIDHEQAVSNFRYIGEGGEWTPCQRCAAHYDRDTAHREHRDRPDWEVVRLVRRERRNG